MKKNSTNSTTTFFLLTALSFSGSREGSWSLSQLHMGEGKLSPECQLIQGPLWAFVFFFFFSCSRLRQRCSEGGDFCSYYNTSHDLSTLGLKLETLWLSAQKFERIILIMMIKPVIQEHHGSCSSYGHRYGEPGGSRTAEHSVNRCIIRFPPAAETGRQNHSWRCFAMWSTDTNLRHAVYTRWVGVRISSQIRVCLLHGGNFDTLPPCQKHSPCSRHPIFSPRPIAPQLRPTGGCERSTSHCCLQHPDLLPEECRMNRKPWSCDHWGLCNTKKKNNNKKTIKKGPVHEWRNLDFVLKLKLHWDLCKSAGLSSGNCRRLILMIFFCWAQHLWDPLARLHLRNDTFVKRAADGLREEEKQHHQTHKGHWERKQALQGAEMKPSDGKLKTP